MGDELKVGLAGRASRHGADDTTAPLDDAALLERVADGDAAAFEQLYRIYYPRLFGYLFRILRRVGPVEEVLNDVMTAVWRQARGFRGDSRVSTWIFGIAYRQAMRSTRRSRSQPILVQPEDGVTAVEPDDAERQALDRELRLSLATALEHLSMEHRAVVELTYYYGYSYAEIGRIVGCPENTVKTRMFHARRKLRRLVPELARGATATMRGTP